MKYRKGEPHKGIRYRSDRFFDSRSEWYFATRECLTLGPYATRRAAEKGLKQYLIEVEQALAPVAPTPASRVLCIDYSY